MKRISYIIEYIVPADETADLPEILEKMRELGSGEVIDVTIVEDKPKN